jgi:hypothetical protein
MNPIWAKQQGRSPYKKHGQNEIGNWVHALPGSGAAASHAQQYPSRHPAVP